MPSCYHHPSKLYVCHDFCYGRVSVQDLVGIDLLLFIRRIVRQLRHLGDLSIGLQLN
jgi:hypothetical protein